MRGLLERRRTACAISGGCRFRTVSDIGGHGAGRWLATVAMTKPLAALTRAGDKLGVKLVRRPG